MKRKLIIIGDMRHMMREIFELDDLEVDSVKAFMEKDYIDIFDVIKDAAKSDLTDRQKMLVAYIEAMNMDKIARNESDNNMINFAG